MPLDADDRVDADLWVSECSPRSAYTQEMYERFVNEYFECGYAILPSSRLVTKGFFN